MATDSILVEPGGERHSLDDTRIEQKCKSLYLTIHATGCNVADHILLSDIRRMFQEAECGLDLGSDPSSATYKAGYPCELWSSSKP